MSAIGDGDAGGFIIQRAGPGDADALAAVSQATYLETFAEIVGAGELLAYLASAHSCAHYAGWLARGDMALWLARHAGTGAPLGYAVLSPVEIEGFTARATDLELRRIYVLATHHGGGLGHALLDGVIAEARRRGGVRLVLGMHEDTRRSAGFYARKGFVEIGQRTFMVGDVGYPNVVLAKRL